MSDWLEPDIKEAEEFIDDKVPAPEGEYDMRIQSVAFRKAKSGTPYLEWFLVHNNPQNKFAPVYERTMLSGKGAFRYFQMFNALGYKTDDIKKSFKYKTLAPLTEENAKKGVPVEMMLMGEKFVPIGKTFKAKLKQVDTESGLRSEIGSYVRK